MAVNLSPVGGVAAQFFTNSGTPLTGGKIFTYAAGTTTPQATYTSSVGNVPWTNPIVLDAAGRVPSGGEIWLTDGLTYKFLLKDANDVLIATYDNISGINSNFIAFTNQQEIVTATAGQTVFNLGINYQPGTNSLSVFVDGVNQYGSGAQYAYVETDSNTVTFTTGLHVGAEVKFTTSQQQGAGAVDAEQVSYDPPFTGSVPTNVEAKLAQTISVKDFGAVGDGVTDDTVAIQAAINYVQTRQGTLLLGIGSYKITSPLILSTNTVIQGELSSFGSAIYPHNTAAFVIDGATVSGGYAFNIKLRNFMIRGDQLNNTQPYVIQIKDSYRVELDNIRVQNITVGTANVSNIISVEGSSLFNTLTRVMANGNGNTGAGSCLAINTNPGNTVFVNNCDFENANIGIYCAPNARADILEPYLERCGTSIRIDRALSSVETAQINIYGGTIELPSATSAGIVFFGTFSRNEVINIDGVRFLSSDHATKNNAFDTSALTWSNTNKITISNVDWSWINPSFPVKLQAAALIAPYSPIAPLDARRYTFVKSGVTDNTATDIFKITGIGTNSATGIYVKVKAFTVFNGFGRALEESVYVVNDRTDTNAKVTTKQIIAEVRETDSANYSITTFFVTATPNGNDLDFSITSDFNTAILPSITANFEVEIFSTAAYTVTTL